jgi:hypothetical protein
MRIPCKEGHQDATPAPARELTIPAGRHPVPTQTRLRTRRIPVALYVAALLVLPALVVSGFMSAGLWAGTGTSITAQAGAGKGSGTGSAEGGDGAVAPAAPADVKGSMTVKEVADAFPPLTAAQILAQFKAPPSTPDTTQLKELVEASDGMDIPALRTWLLTQLPKT